jgi:hypothetical protein
MIRNREAFKRAVEQMKAIGGSRMATDEEMLELAEKAFATLTKEELVSIVADLSSAVGSDRRQAENMAQMDEIVEEVSQTPKKEDLQ